jgi:hypothetical protein
MNELEAKLNQIVDNLLVQTGLVERFERRRKIASPSTKHA